MIEKDKFEWKENKLWYKGIQLDLSPEMIQEIATDFISKETAEKAIKESYERNLRLHREKLLNDLINKK